jgi:hypothetical protein
MILGIGQADIGVGSIIRASVESVERKQVSSCRSHSNKPRQIARQLTRAHELLSIARGRFHDCDVILISFRV